MITKNLLMPRSPAFVIHPLGASYVERVRNSDAGLMSGNPTAKIGCLLVCLKPGGKSWDCKYQSRKNFQE
jgi:hypothetical protein